jgi:N-acetylmuramoyl-L-alanine amidase
MKKISNIIVHCSDSEFGCAAVIRQWHMQQGWKDIGYHFVICNGLLVPQTKKQNKLYLGCMDGSIEVGRPLDGDPFISDNEVGAHALGYNDKSASVCLIGIKNFTEKQMLSLRYIINEMLDIFGLSIDTVKGHYEVCSGKTCPNIDMEKFRREFGGVSVDNVDTYDGSTPIPKSKLKSYSLSQIQKRINYLLRTVGWNDEVSYLVSHRDKK